MSSLTASLLDEVENIASNLVFSRQIEAKKKDTILECHKKLGQNQQKFGSSRSVSS